MQKQKLQIWLPLLISISMIMGMFVGYKIKDNIPGRGFFEFDKPNSIREIIDLIDSKYVDSVNLSNISDSAMAAIINQLDPHSVYIPASELEDINNEINGSFFGIGVEFELYDDTVNITNVIVKGPAALAGILKGDQFIKANNQIMAGKKLSSDSIRKIIKGNIESQLKLEIIRDHKPLSLMVTRNVITVNSIDAYYMIDSTSGYIRINRFSSNTYSDFMTALLDLKKKGLQQLILDLKDNGGGVLDEAVEIADEFLEGDKLITYTMGRKSPRKEYRCRRTGQFEKGKLIILTDEGTASASEILAGALQEWGRATVMGKRTFGKGLVQEQYDLRDGGALRLTIARYYTPSGRCIQRSYADGKEAYYDESYQNSLNPNKSFEDSSITFTTPVGKKVFGGGGISPDVFVENDTSLLNETIAVLINKGTLNKFAFNYYRTNGNTIQKCNNSNAFLDQFSLTDKDWLLIKMMATEDTVNLNSINNNTKTSIETFIKNFVIRYQWNNTAYIEAVNKSDKSYQKAIEFINK